MLIGVPKEVYPGERRVATTPEATLQLQKLGFNVAIETGAGEAAKLRDEEYKNAGVSIVDSTQQLWQSADIILKVRTPNAVEINYLKQGQILISFLAPAQSPELLQQLADKKVTALAMETIPRLSRSQKMDALSSMAASAPVTATTLRLSKWKAKLPKSVLMKSPSY